MTAKDEFAWREAPPAAVSSRSSNKTRRSRGLEPERFHSNSRRRRSRDDDALQELRETIHTSLVTQGKRRVGQRQALRRAAYKQVTECQSWPLQEPALAHFDKLLQRHLHAANGGDDHQHSERNMVVSTVPPPSAVSSSQLASCRSLSSSCSDDVSSLSKENDEPKRLLRTLHSSPNKSRYKLLCRNEFLAEQALPPGLQVSSSSSAIASDGTDDQRLRLEQRPVLWSMEPCIWAWEISNTGKRKYIVGHLGRCLDWYWRKTLAENRHGYELLRQGTPCRLYLDLEYSKVHNPHLRDAEASTVFLNALFLSLARQLQTHFGQQLAAPLERRHVVDLDSSTDKKYSRHWIVHLPGHYLFADNRAVGRFVHEWMGTLMQKVVNGGEATTTEGGSHEDDDNALDPILAKYLLVNTKSSSGGSSQQQTTCIVDLGVYTKNRLFRFLGSCKYGKPASAALRIAKENQFPFPPHFGNAHFYKGAQEDDSDEPAPPQTRPLRARDHNHDDDMPELGAVQEYKATIDWEPHAEALAQTLVIPINATKIQYPILPNLPGGGDSSSGVKIGPTGETTKSHHCHTPQSYGASPFPLLDQFVLTQLATRGGVQGSIRTWSLEKTGSTHDNNNTTPVLMTYFLDRNRYCQHIQRHHKSNGIFWMVDFVTGHATQRCFDPDCRGFGSRPVPVPPYVRDHIRQCIVEQQRQEQQQLVDDDNELLSQGLGSLQISASDDHSATTTLSTAGGDDDEDEQKQDNNPMEDLLLSDQALLDAMMDNPELFP